MTSSHNFINLFRRELGSASTLCSADCCDICFGWVWFVVNPHQRLFFPILQPEDSQAAGKMLNALHQVHSKIYGTVSGQPALLPLLWQLDATPLAQFPSSFSERWLGLEMREVGDGRRGSRSEEADPNQCDKPALDVSFSFLTISVILMPGKHIPICSVLVLKVH